MATSFKLVDYDVEDGEILEDSEDDIEEMGIDDDDESVSSDNLKQNDEEQMQIERLAMLAKEEDEIDYEEAISETPDFDSIRNSPFCVICKHPMPKYRCPACECRTCSLKCCQQHKVLNACDGVVPRSRMVFMNDYDNLTMLNDYRFLEEAARVRELSKKLLDDSDPANLRPKRDFNWDQLFKQCKRQNIKLRRLPPVFEKNRANCSSYDKIADTIFWKLEWIFMNANGLRIEMTRIPETVSLLTLLKRIVHPKPNSDYAYLREKLSMYSSVDPLSDLTCLLKAPGNENFYEMDVAESIKNNLRRRLVFEYPTIYICTHEHALSLKIISKEMETELDKERSKNIRLINNEERNNKGDEYAQRKPGRRFRKNRRRFNKSKKPRQFETHPNEVSSANDAVKEQPIVKNVEPHAMNVDETLAAKPLKRLLPLHRQQQQQPRTFQRNNQQVKDNFRLQKQNVIKQLADELYQKERERKETSNVQICIVKENVEDKVRPIILAPNSKKVSGGFFGLLGSADFSFSDSDE